MALKYIEKIKSVLLFTLIALSLYLTFSIWSYTPNYEPIEQMSTVDISIAEKRKVEEVIQPYKVVVQSNQQLKGTIHEQRIEELFREIRDWRAVSLTLHSEKFGKKRVADTLKKEGALMIYYQGEVPFRAYENVFKMSDLNVPEASFDRIIVKKEPKRGAYRLYFVNRQHEYYYEATTQIPQIAQYERFFTTWSEQIDDYVTIHTKGPSFIAVPAEDVTFEHQTYYQEEINPTRFRDALFRDPNAVRRSQVNAHREEYADDHALMTVDTDLKMLHYVYPNAESQEIAIPSELLFNSIDFINEHGGWTDEYRFVHIDPITRYVRFQLFVHGLPVYSDYAGTTEIVQNYGQTTAFRYNRPYYSFDSTLLLDRVDETIPSGVTIMRELKKQPRLEYDEIEDISPGYVMIQDPEQRLFLLKPSWFYLVSGHWYRYDFDTKGGDVSGLE